MSELPAKRRRSTEKRKLIIDCDIGTDDAQAIMMALSQPHVEVCAIMTVFGNAGQAHTCVNTLRLLKFLGRLDVSSLFIVMYLYQVKCPEY